jgi:microcystin-dependent protein
MAFTYLPIATIDKSSSTTDTVYPTLDPVEGPPTPDTVGPTSANQQATQLDYRTETLRDRVNKAITTLTEMTSELLQRGGSSVGSYMKGDLDMKDPSQTTGNKIINLADGTASSDAVNKGQLDGLSAAITATELTLANAVLRDGSVAMTGNLDLGGFRIKNCSDPVVNTDIATKGYVDTQAALVTGTYLRLDGTNSMAGNLNMGGYAVVNCGLPAAPTDAVTVEYMNTQLSGLGAAPVGSIAFWPGDSQSAPSGWLFCDGFSVSKTTFAGLFSVIGYTFGGSGDIFNLPDLRGRVVCGMDDFGGAGVPAGVLTNHPNLNQVGGTDGSESHALSTAEIPSHNHTYSDTYLSTIASGGTLQGPALGSGSGYYAAVQDNLVTAAAGGGQAHNNIQPTMAMSVIIKV